MDFEVARLALQVRDARAQLSGLTMVFDQALFIARAEVADLARDALQPLADPMLERLQFGRAVHLAGQLLYLPHHQFVV